MIKYRARWMKVIAKLIYVLSTFYYLNKNIRLMFWLNIRVMWSKNKVRWINLHIYILHSSMYINTSNRTMSLKCIFYFYTDIIHIHWDFHFPHTYPCFGNKFRYFCVHLSIMMFQIQMLFCRMSNWLLLIVDIYQSFWP